jgi:hypothetical protein
MMFGIHRERVRPFTSHYDQTLPADIAILNGSIEESVQSWRDLAIFSWQSVF